MKLTAQLQRRGTIRDTKELRKSRPDPRASLFGEPKNKKMAATTQGPARPEPLSLMANEIDKKEKRKEEGRLDILAEALEEESALDVRADVDGDSSESEISIGDDLSDDDSDGSSQSS